MIDLDKLAEDWPSPFVARCKISEFTHGLYKQSSMNTLDARGDGLKRRIILGNKIAYLKTDIIDWLKRRKRND
ncbi:MAG: hypothetical protein IJA14_03445 [Alphaproteobacteria bacterium]|nr:hypothetical protein [Alphaproteobacteria bacterium]